MRLFVSGLLAAGLLTSQMAAAQCVRPAENAALDVAGLKTQLMVTALTCGAQARYDAFVTRFKAELNRDERAAGTYFSRAYGRNSKARQDAYATQLANSRSESGLQHGTLFCERNLGVFEEVMALRDGAELEQFAAAHTTGNPAETGACGNAAEPTTRASSRGTTRSTAHRRS